MNEGESLYLVMSRLHSRYVMLLTFFSIALSLSSCKPAEVKVAAVTPLLKDFSPEEITELVVTDRHRHVRLKLKEGKWFVTEPYEALALRSKVGNLLETLATKEQGIRIDIAASDYARLQVEEPTNSPESKSIKMELISASGTRSVYFGSTTLPVDITDAAFFGEAALTRRHVRDAVTEKVSLVNYPFAEMSSRSSDWVDCTFRKLNRVQKVHVELPDGKQWSAYRDSQLKAFQADQDVAINNAAKDCLNTLFSDGYFLDLIPPNEVAKHFSNKIGKIHLTDFQKAKYTVTLHPALTLDMRNDSQKMATSGMLVEKSERLIVEAYPCHLVIEEEGKTQELNVYFASDTLSPLLTF